MYVVEGIFPPQLPCGACPCRKSEISPTWRKVFQLFFTCFYKRKAPSSRIRTLTMWNSNRESQSVVLSWRPGLHYRCFRYGRGHGTGSGLSVFRSGTSEIRSDHDMDLHGQLLCHHFSVVFLGLFSRLLIFWTEWIYRRSEALRFDVYSGVC